MNWEKKQFIIISGTLIHSRLYRLWWWREQRWRRAVPTHTTTPHPTSTSKYNSLVKWRWRLAGAIQNINRYEPRILQSRERKYSRNRWMSSVFLLCDCDRLASVAPAAVCWIHWQRREDECPDHRLLGWEARKVISNVKEHPTHTRSDNFLIRIL